MRATLLTGPVLLVLLSPGSAAERVSSRDLIAAGTAAKLSQIDQMRRDCGDDRSVAAWLKDVLGDSAKRITWSGGVCRLTNKQNPIDAGGGVCAQAEITPKSGRDNATIEIYFDAPVRGRPGAPFAFRAVVHTKDGWDYMRETSAFAVNWRETYAAGAPAVAPSGHCE